jgi:hypothetical protein
MMRDIVVQNTTSKRIIKFANTEYHTQPGGFKSSFYNSPSQRDSQVAINRMSAPTLDLPSTQIEMTEMDISEQREHKIREIV